MGAVLSWAAISIMITLILNPCPFPTMDAPLSWGGRSMTPNAVPFGKFHVGGEERYLSITHYHLWRSPSMRECTFSFFPYCLLPRRIPLSQQLITTTTFFVDQGLEERDGDVDQYSRACELRRDEGYSIWHCRSAVRGCQDSLHWSEQVGAERRRR
jgi:hypothetical protein